MRPNTGLGLSLSLLGGLLSTSLFVEAAGKPKNAILLSEVQSLTLKAQKQTTHRRVPAIPQLKCVSPRAICRLHEIDTLRCVNQGSSYSREDIEWACTATDLPTTLRLGSTEVICEGYSSPDDPYVLRGSCGVEYRLVLTEEGERRYPELANGGGGKGWKLGGDENGETDWGGYLFAIIFFAVLGWIIYSACAAADGGSNNNPRRNTGGGGRRPGGGGGGGWGGGGWGPGGGGGGGWDDPPPPYSKSTYTGGGEQGWRPGFWSGAATGAAAGYFAGNRAANNNTARGGYNDTGSSSFWGGGGGGSSSRRNDSGSGSGSSSGRHESTGFGSTSRR